jgi:hypothetical protein
MGGDVPIPPSSPGFEVLVTDHRERRRTKPAHPPLLRKFDLGDALLLIDRHFSAESAKRRLTPDERALWFGIVDYGVGTQWGQRPPRADRLIRIEMKRARITRRRTRT